MNSVAKINPDTPTAISPILGTKLSVLSNRCLRLPGRAEIDIELLPETRQALEARVARIVEWMRPAGPELALREVTVLFSVLGTQNRDQDDRELSMRVYCASLGELPAFALRSACKRFVDGQVADCHWMPTPGEIHQVAQGILGPLTRQRRNIEDVLGAVYVRPNLERRQATVAACKAKLKDMGDAGRAAEDLRMRRRDREREQRKAETEAERMERLQSPMALSDEARRKFHRPGEGSVLQEAS